MTYLGSKNIKHRLSDASCQTSNVQQGFSLVEVILASAVFVSLVTALVGAYIYGQESTALAGNRGRAVMLTEEGLEAVRNIRDPSFSCLIDGTHGLAVSGGVWVFSGSQDTNGIFTRQVIISSVDTKRKLVTANVTWQQNPQRSGIVSFVSRLTNWIASGVSNWASPIQVASIDAPGINDGIKIQVQCNYAYMILAGGSPNFLVIDVSNPASPSIAGSLTLTGTPTNIAVSGNYVYVSNTDNNQELQIIDVFTPSSPSVVGAFNASGGADARGVYAIGTTVYLVRASSANDEFLIVNATVPSLPVLVGSLNLGAQGNEVAVSGNYAYVASSGNSQELQVIDITVPVLPTLAGSLNLSGNANAITIAPVGSAVFIGQGNTLYSINVTDPLLPSILGSLGVSGTLNDIALNLGNANTYLFIATSHATNEFKVIDVTTLTSLVLLGSVNVPGTNPLFGIAYDSTFDRAFAVGQLNTGELVVLAPQ